MSSPLQTAIDELQASYQALAEAKLPDQAQLRPVQDRAAYVEPIVARGWPKLAETASRRAQACRDAFNALLKQRGALLGELL